MRFVIHEIGGKISCAKYTSRWIWLPWLRTGQWIERTRKTRESRLGAARLIRLRWWTGTDVQVYKNLVRSRLATKWAAGVSSCKWEKRVGWPHPSWQQGRTNRYALCPHKPWRHKPINALCLFRYNCHGEAVLLLPSETQVNMQIQSMLCCHRTFTRTLALFP